MKRAGFIRLSTLAAAGIMTGAGTFRRTPQTHILTLSFDDGFKKSFYRIAEIHEEYGLKACLNVVAHASEMKNTDYLDPVWHAPQAGSYDDWNALKARGHEIMPHSWDHANLKEMPLEKAKEDIMRCLEHFEKNLDGYRNIDAVYNFAYNASTPELVEFTLSRVKAVRTGGWDVLGKDLAANPLPAGGEPRVLGCWSYGPDNADAWTEKVISDFLLSPGGWLVLNLHGLDEEGWGPVSSSYLDSLLKKLVKLEHLSVKPAGMVLA